MIDLGNLMKMAGQFRAQMAQAQEETGRLRYTGEAGAGLVRVVMSGRYEAVEVHIDPKIATTGEVGLLEDLVRAAINQAAARVMEGQKNNLTEFARRFGIDASLSSLFGP